MFRVIWAGKAFDQMGQIIRNNPARKEELAEALQELTARLQTQGDTTGESRGRKFRVLITPPLTVYFQTDASTSTATLVGVHVRFTA